MSIIDRVSELTTAFLVGIVLALMIVWGIDHDPDLNPTPATPTPSATADRPVTCGVTVPCDPDPWEPESVTPGQAPADGIAEGTPGFNCLTMGDMFCGDGWDVMPDDVFEHLQGRPQTAEDYCLWKLADVTLVNCTDGLVTTS